MFKKNYLAIFHDDVSSFIVGFLKFCRKTVGT